MLYNILYRYALKEYVTKSYLESRCEESKLLEIIDCEHIIKFNEAFCDSTDKYCIIFEYCEVNI